MKWISVKDKLPDGDCVCLVLNSKGYMSDIRALYYKRDNVFKLYDLRCYETLLLDVTHYLILPEFKEKQDGMD